MAVTDPVADMLTRIRNACKAKFESVEIPASKLKSEIARILKQEGYINDYELLADNKQGIIRIQLKYDKERLPVIRALKRVSKPGNRKHVNKHNIPRVLNDLGIAILSTSQGVLTSQEARRMGVGGEVLCYVW